MKEHDLNETNDAVTAPSKKERRSHVLPIACTCLAIAVIAIIVLCIYFAIKINDLENENKSLKANATTETQAEEPEALKLSFENNSFDPCDFMYGNYVFDKTPNHFIAGLKKGIDYSVSDSLFETLELYTYTIYPDFEYLGIKTEQTSISLVAENEDSAIESISYNFRFPYKDSEAFLNLVNQKVSSVCGKYVSCTRLSNNGLENMYFGKFVNSIHSNLKGNYNIQWTTNGYAITLNVDCDSEFTDAEGCLTIALKKF